MMVYAKIAILFVVASLLSGCAIFGYNRELIQECQNAPVVYSNLQQPLVNQTYHLPRGAVCPEGRV